MSAPAAAADVSSMARASIVVATMKIGTLRDGGGERHVNHPRLLARHFCYVSSQHAVRSAMQGIFLLIQVACKHSDMI
eukprot:6207162-Pleurochrysis_carterae.AAC.8